MLPSEGAAPVVELGGAVLDAGFDTTGELAGRAEVPKVADFDADVEAVEVAEVAEVAADAAAALLATFAL